MERNIFRDSLPVSIAATHYPLRPTYFSRKTANVYPITSDIVYFHKYGPRFPVLVVAQMTCSRVLRSRRSFGVNARLPATPSIFYAKAIFGLSCMQMAILL